MMGPVLTAFVALALLVCLANCQDYPVALQSEDSPPPAAYLSLAGTRLPNNSRVNVRHIGVNGTLGGLRCHTDLVSSCCGSGAEHGGRWMLVGRSSADFYQQSEGQGWVELHSVELVGTGNYRCEIDTAASIARGGPREILYAGVTLGCELFYL